MKTAARRPSTKTLHRVALLAALLLACFTADARTRSYFGPNNGLWTTAANWRVAGVPMQGDAFLNPITAGPSASTPRAMT